MRPAGMQRGLLSSDVRACAEGAVATFFGQAGRLHLVTRQAGQGRDVEHGSNHDLPSAHAKRPCCVLPRLPRSQACCAACSSGTWTCPWLPGEAGAAACWVQACQGIMEVFGRLCNEEQPLLRSSAMLLLIAAPHHTHARICSQVAVHRRTWGLCGGPPAGGHLGAGHLPVARCPAGQAATWVLGGWMFDVWGARECRLCPNRNGPALAWHMDSALLTDSCSSSLPPFPRTPD